MKKKYGFYLTCERGDFLGYAVTSDEAEKLSDWYLKNTTVELVGIHDKEGDGNHA